MYIGDNQVEFLSGLVGSISEHIRLAIDEYIVKKKELNVSVSPSKKNVKSK